MFKDIFSFNNNRNDFQLNKFNKKIVNFYSTISVYDDYNIVNYKPEFWQSINEIIKVEVQNNKDVSILEFGAGKSSFPNFVNKNLRKEIKLVAQDIVPTNKEYLTTIFDEVYIGQLNEMNIKEMYNIIFSTFVWEHIVNPEVVLNHLLQKIKPTGSLILFCPRYDFPFYISPSAKHYNKIKRFFISIFIAYQRISSILTRSSKFLIHLEPAIFYLNWRRDYDAIHWVSYWDIKYSLPYEYQIEKIRIRIDNKSFLYKFWARYLLLAVQIKRKTKS